MSLLASLLTDHRNEICQTLRILDSDWQKRIPTIVSPRLNRSGGFYDEATWTFLVACGYAICGGDGVAKLTELLTGRPDLNQQDDSGIWLEFRPMTPRVGEGRTHLDLAIGTITPDGTKSGIELDYSSGSRSWICFCEMKWESPLDFKVANDPNRNQLVRVIESALRFQNTEFFVHEVYVTLVTPAFLKEYPDYKKLYPQKFDDYKSDSGNILEDLRNCTLEPRNNFDPTERIDSLTLRWQTFDELFASIPNSPVSDALESFWQNYGTYLNRG